MFQFTCSVECLIEFNPIYITIIFVGWGGGSRVNSSDEIFLLTHEFKFAVSHMMSHLIVLVILCSI